LAAGVVVAFIAVLVRLQGPPPWYAGSWVAEGADLPQLELAGSGNQITGQLIVNHPNGKYRLALPLLYGEAGHEAVLFSVENRRVFARPEFYLAHYEGPGVLGLYRLAPPPPNRPYTATLLPIVSAQQRVAVLVSRHHAGALRPDPNPQEESKSP
jgi:hypothetical protein